MDRSVAHLNVERYRRLLMEESDEAKRLILTRLLAEEEAKLRGATPNAPPEQKN